VGGGRDGDAAGAEIDSEPRGAGKKRKGGPAAALLGLVADRAGRGAAGPKARLARLKGSQPDDQRQKQGYAVAGSAQKGPLDVKERAREVRRQLGAAWMALLRCRLPRSVIRSAVVKLHSVIPLLPKPLLLADVLSAC